ncbi:hypothetical protein L209DRAFT_406976 [Thermothelomyces heterothallicus CBS 203.75]
MARSNPDEIDLAEDDFDDTSPNDYEVAEEAATMAATMGFTSFAGGDGAPPSKKRRFNPRLDEAVIATGEPAPAAHTGQAKAAPVGPATRDEITYNDDDHDNFSKDDDGDGADDLDPDGPPTPPRTASPALTAGSQAAGAWPNPSKPSRGWGGGGRGGARGGGGRGGRGGPLNPLWYVDYYDPSFNENPWEGMEKFKGLEPVGTWLSRSRGREKEVGTGKDEQQQQQPREGVGAGQELAEHRLNRGG